MSLLDTLLYVLFDPPDVYELEDKRNIRGLIRALRYPDPENSRRVRSSAAEALRRLKAAKAVRQLCVCLRDESRDVREKAASVLWRIGAPAVKGLSATLSLGMRSKKINEPSREAGR
jgi:HEAT repeat protein